MPTTFATLWCTEYTNLWSKTFLIGCLTLLIAHLINLSFVEQNSDVGPFLRRHSKVAIYMPAIFSFRLILFTLLIYFFHKSSTLPAYFLIILEFAYLIFVVGGHPHKRSFDTVRAAIVEAGLLYILSMRYLEIELFAEYVSPQSKLYPAIAYTEYVFYALAVGLSIVAIGYHLLKKFRKKEE